MPESAAANDDGACDEKIDAAVTSSGRQQLLRAFMVV